MQYSEKEKVDKISKGKLNVLARPSMGPVGPMFWCPQHGSAFGPVGSTAAPPKPESLYVTPCDDEV